MNEDTRIAGRGLEFSAAYRRQQAEQYLIEGTDYVLPLRQRIEDGIDTHGLQQASASLPIPPDNKGYLLLQKMGWKGPGQGLGKKSDGLHEPVDLNAMDAGMRLGLGKMQQDAQFTAAENINRKQLEAEIQMNEDEDRKEKRLERVEQQARIQEEVKKIRQTFYCEVCDKTYKYAAELEEHLSSYSHHHTKRLREMKKMEHDRTREQRERKALKRSQKEMARLDRQVMAAHGAQQPANPPLPTSAPPPLPPDESADLPNAAQSASALAGKSASQGGWSSSKDERGSWGKPRELAGGGGWSTAPSGATNNEQGGWDDATDRRAASEGAWSSVGVPTAGQEVRGGWGHAGGSADNRAAAMPFERHARSGEAAGWSSNAGTQPARAASQTQGHIYASSHEQGRLGGSHAGRSHARRWDSQPSSASVPADAAVAGTGQGQGARASRWDRQPSHNSGEARPSAYPPLPDPPLPPEPPSAACPPPPPPPAAKQSGFSLSFSLGGSGAGLGGAPAQTGIGAGKGGGRPAFGFPSSSKPAVSSKVSALFGDDEPEDMDA